MAAQEFPENKVRYRCACGKEFGSRFGLQGHRGRKTDDRCPQPFTLLVPGAGEASPPPQSSPPPVRNIVTPPPDEPGAPLPQMAEEQFDGEEEPDSSELFLGGPPPPAAPSVPAEAPAARAEDLPDFEDVVTDYSAAKQSRLPKVVEPPDAPAPKKPPALPLPGEVAPTGIRETLTFAVYARAMYDAWRLNLGYEGTFNEFIQECCLKLWAMAGYEIRLVAIGMDGRENIRHAFVPPDPDQDYDLAEEMALVAG